MFLGNMVVVIFVFSSQFNSSFTILLQHAIHPAFHVPGSGKKGEGGGGRGKGEGGRGRGEGKGEKTKRRQRKKKEEKKKKSKKRKNKEQTTRTLNTLVGTLAKKDNHKNTHVSYHI
jgi:hypothetical protein